jgi:hypothetical protein
MATVDPVWSLDAVLRDYRPYPGFRSAFGTAYAQAMESADPDEQLTGWRTAAWVFGDMHVPVFCLFVCHHGRTLEPPGGTRFLGHIDLCLWELGLATPVLSDADGTAVTGLGKPDGFRRDDEGAREWLAGQLRPFGGDVARAAAFAMRLTATRFGLLLGPADPSIAQVLDESLWRRERPARKKPWWRVW